jgi:hypothetical protein
MPLSPSRRTLAVLTLAALLAFASPGIARARPLDPSGESGASPCSSWTASLVGSGPEHSPGMCSAALARQQSRSAGNLLSLRDYFRRLRTIS